MYLVALCIGAVVAYRFMVGDDFKTDGAKSNTAEESEVETITPARKDRGPRPENVRLRDGAKQIEDRVEAIQHTREALERVKKEIAEAQDEKTRAALERKLELIEETIEKFSSGDIQAGAE